MEKILLIRVYDLIEIILSECEHIHNMLEMFEVGFANDHYDEKGLEISSVHILGKHIERLKSEYVKEVADILHDYIKGGCDNLPKNEHETPCTPSMDLSEYQR